MTNLIPRDLWLLPRRNIPNIIDEVDDLFSFGQAESASAISVSEDEKSIYVEAPVPGIEPDDIEVTYERGMLWIHGEAREEEKDKKRRFYRRATQTFSYRVAIPGNMDPKAEPQAEYKNGIIMVTFPKTKSATSKKIAIKKSKTNGESKSKAN